MNGVKQQSEEDELFHPRVASPNIRDLQVDAVSIGLANAFVDTNDNGVIVITFEDGKVIQCDDNALSESDLLHCKYAMEQDGNDGDGMQGGQNWKPPTQSPSKSPTKSPTKAPTNSPTNIPTIYTTESQELTDGPTPRGDPFVLRGIIWYDRNANGRRDSNVDDPEHGPDVETNVGLGGVQVRLMECDPDTNKALSMGVYSEGDNSYAATISRGYNALMHAMLVNKAEDGGKFNLTNIKVARSYFIYVQAPSGYLFTGGVCNDDVVGWECKYAQCDENALNKIDLLHCKNAMEQDGNDADGMQGGQDWKPPTHRPTTKSDFAAGGGGRRMGHFSPRGLEQANLTNGTQVVNPNAKLPSERELELGVREGRSTACVSVDQAGVPDARFDLGVMRVGDHHFDDTEVVLGVNLINIQRKLHRSPREGHSLTGHIRRRIMGRDLSSRQKEKNSDGFMVYELASNEEEAIGDVTAEVIAANLDRAIERNGGVLDSVSHIGVTYYAPESDGSESRGEGGRLEVDLQVRGHYTANLNIDFDYIVEDSINRESENIRRQLTTYNQNCNNQKEKINDLGYTVDDFSEIQSNYGVKELHQRQQDMNSVQHLIWSTACDKEAELPQFVEENLKSLEASLQVKSIVVDDGGISMWSIVGIVVSLGMVALGFAYFFFRRGMANKRKGHDECFDGESLDSTDPKTRRPEGDLDEKVSGGDIKSSTSPAFEAGKPTDIAGVVHNKLSNMTAALNSEWRRLRRGGNDSVQCTTSEVAPDESVQESKYTSSRGNYSRTSRGGSDSTPRSHASHGEARSNHVVSKYSLSTRGSNSTQRTNTKTQKSSMINDSRVSAQQRKARPQRSKKSERHDPKSRLQNISNGYSSKGADHSVLHCLGSIQEGSVVCGSSASALHKVSPNFECSSRGAGHSVLHSLGSIQEGSVVSASSASALHKASPDLFSNISQLDS